MLDVAIPAFVGAFAAIVAIAEVQISSKPIKYLVALLAGALLAVLLALVLSWMIGMLGRAGR